MTGRPKFWFDRSFELMLDPGTYLCVLERLAGTPARLEEKVQHIPRLQLSQPFDGKWSILENIGHLLTLEPLWSGRIDDLQGGLRILRSADLKNRATFEGNFNETTGHTLLTAFRTARQDLVDKFRAIAEEDLGKKALHPRLKTPMGLIDLAFFVAEHDDHHLATIHYLAAK